MGIRGRVIAILGGAAFASASEAAHGATRPIEIDWTAPVECPSKEQFIEGLRDASEAVSTLEPLRVSLAIKRKKSSLYSGVLTTAASGSRTFEGSTCDEVLDAASLVLSMQLDSELIAPTSESTRSLTPAGPEQAPIEPEFDEPPPKKKKSEPPPRLNLATAFAIDLGALSNALVGMEGTIGTDIGRVRLEAGGALFLPESREKFGRVLSGSASYGVARLSVHVVESDRIAIRARASLSYTMLVLAEGTTPMNEATSNWFGAGVGASAEWRVTRALAVDFGLEGIGPFQRPRSGFPDLSLEERPRPVVYRGFLGAHILLF